MDEDHVRTALDRGFADGRRWRRAHPLPPPLLSNGLAVAVALGLVAVAWATALHASELRPPGTVLMVPFWFAVILAQTLCGHPGGVPTAVASLVISAFYALAAANSLWWHLVWVAVHLVGFRLLIAVIPQHPKLRRWLVRAYQARWRRSGDHLDEAPAARSTQRSRPRPRPLRRQGLDAIRVGRW